MDAGPLHPSAALPPARTAAKPAPVDLRPLSTSELIDRGFTLYRSHFTGFLLLALICQSAPLLGQILVSALKLNPNQVEVLENPLGSLGRLALIMVILFTGQLFVFFFEVVIAHYIAAAYLGGAPSVKASFNKAKASWAAATWTCILNWILIGAAMIFPVIAAVAVTIYTRSYLPATLLPIIAAGVGSVLVLVASLVPVLIVFIRLMTTVPALALEGRSGWQAVKRSSELVRFDPGLGFFYWGEMRLSFLLLPLFVIELLILILTTLPFTIHRFSDVILHGSNGQIVPPPDLVMILSQIMIFLAGSFILPLYSIATTLFYYDIRIRREGFDLEYLSGKLGEEK